MTSRDAAELKVANEDAVVACLCMLEIKTRSFVVHFSTF